MSQSANQEQAPQLQYCQRIGQVFSLLGKRWNGPLLDLLLQRPARFAEISHTIPGLSDKVLCERLKELEAAGLVSHSDGLYAVTDSGQAIEPALQELRRWADQL